MPCPAVGVRPTARWNQIAAMLRTMAQEGRSLRALAAQLRPDDAKKAAVELGIAPDLIPIPSRAGVDAELLRVLARSTRRQALVAATVLFCSHALAARAGNASRARALKEAARKATLRGCQNPALAHRPLSRRWPRCRSWRARHPALVISCFRSPSISLHRQMPRRAS